MGKKNTKPLMGKRVSFNDLERETPKTVVMSDPKDNLLPIKEAEVPKGVLSGKTPGQAVREAGYLFPNNDVAQRFGEHLIEKHSKNNGVLTAHLEAVGVSLETLAKKIAEGLDATTTVKKGSDVEIVPDFNARHKYLDTALDIYPNARAPKQVNVQQTSFEAKLLMIANLGDDDE